ncbi:hypothetical protein QMK61_10855 [Fulvimonas sp. R45]|uniref:hypothetical protein n=1 Tax=Fulvimonas sp. R45 TaxID=3045937 RepID=UPI00265FC1CB|nr:hypothetical protein [Fulvimonas sp. R45]MDO1529326.1 hypothetical protein [Fulvimonas sp. R45]
MDHDASDDGLPRWMLRPRQQRLLGQLLDGGLAPLRGFLGRADYDSVLATMHLADGTPCPLPVTLDVDEAFAATLDVGAHVQLCDRHGTPLARLDLDDIYHPDHLREARLRYGRMDRRHPAVVELLRHTGTVYLGGRVHDLREPGLGQARRRAVADPSGVFPGWAYAIEVAGVAGSRLLH